MNTLRDKVADELEVLVESSMTLDEMAKRILAIPEIAEALATQKRDDGSRRGVKFSINVPRA